MSALGHKRTCAVRNAMSALPSKADMCSALAHVPMCQYTADMTARYHSGLNRRNAHPRNYPNSKRQKAGNQQSNQPFCQRGKPS